MVFCQCGVLSVWGFVLDSNTFNATIIHTFIGHRPSFLLRNQVFLDLLCN